MYLDKRLALAQRLAGIASLHPPYRMYIINSWPCLMRNDFSIIHI